MPLPVPLLNRVALLYCANDVTRSVERFVELHQRRVELRSRIRVYQDWHKVQKARVIAFSAHCEVPVSLLEALNTMEANLKELERELSPWWRKVWRKASER